MEKIKTFVKNFFEEFTLQKKIGLGVAAAVLLALLIGVVVLIAGGFGENPSGTYTVEVITEGGKPLEEIGVYIYTDKTQQDLVNVAKTDEEGKITFDSKNAFGTFIVLKDVPRGYKVEETYEIKSKETSIILEIELLSTENLEGITFELGDVFADLSVEATNGKTYTISKLLKEKKAVVLNFWYLNCNPCKMEFPYLQEAYENYKDEIEVIALNPVDGTQEAITEFAKELGLTFPMASCDAQWETIMGLTSYPTTVIIDRYGTIAFIHKGMVTDTATFEKMFDSFVGENYKQTTYKSVDEMGTDAEGDGSLKNPFLMVETNFEASVEPEQVVYYQMYKVNGMILTIKDKDAYVIYNGETYNAKDGVVSLTLVTEDVSIPAVFGIGNSGKEKKTFDINVEFKIGSSGKPYELTLGKVDVNVEANNDQGIYYLYKAKESGTITISCLSGTEGVEYLFSLYNLNTYAMKNSEEDTQTDVKGNPSVSIVVNKGDEVQFSVGTLPGEGNEYPAGNFTFDVTFVEGEGTDANGEMVAYTIHVKDKNGKAISGVNISISSNKITPITVTTNASGVAKTTLKAGTYKAIVSAPSGYKMDTTEYKLTATKTMITITLEKKSTVTKTYTVKVVDAKNTPLSGVLVTVGDNYGTTNSSGSISFTLLEDNYTASASKDGYELASKAFGSSTSVTITLKKESNTGATSSNLSYSVTVVDYAGNPIKDAAVSFVNGGKIVKTVIVSSNGSATATLVSGNYGVEVKFPSGKDYGYDKSQATLSASKTSTKVIAATKADTSDVTNVWDMYTMQDVYTGGVYMEIQSNANNFLLFAPNKSGRYTIKTSNINAKVVNCGTTVGYFNQNPSYSTNEFTIDIYDDQVANHLELVLSVSGASECVLIIERTGNPGALISYNEYNATTPPTAFMLSNIAGKTQKFVDITGTFKIVKGSDGYYHKDNENGPVIYVTLDEHAKYISMKDLCGLGPLRSLEKGEEYTNCMLQYVDCVDTTYGVYPLTDDLRHMFQWGGEAKGWYNPNVIGGFYLFSGKTVNLDIAWMFECCYFE